MYMEWGISMFTVPSLKHPRLPENNAMDVRSSSSSISHGVSSEERKTVDSVGSVLSFEHVSYTVSTKSRQKTLIDDISVSICAGELLAIMVR